jgi:hypothetical protein
MESLLAMTVSENANPNSILQLQAVTPEDLCHVSGRYENQIQTSKKQFHADLAWTGEV